MVGSADQQRLKAFISYSRKDSDFAEDLLLALEAAGFEPYLDKHDIVPGEPWEARLDRLIQAADTVVYVISPDSIRSERCEWEVRRTEELSKRLIPVVWRDVAEQDTPARLKRLNYVFFCGEGRSFARGLAALVQALKTDIDWIREHTAIGELATRWQGKGRIEALLLRGDEIANAKVWTQRRPKDAPEPTLLQREFIAESEKAEQARIALEKAQAAAMKNAEIDRLRAEQESNRLRLEVLEKQRRQTRILLVGLVLLGALGAGFAWRELKNSEEKRIAAEELSKSQQQIKDYEKQLAEIKQVATKATDLKGGEQLARAANEAARAVTETLTPDETRRLISKDAIDLMIAFEVGSRASYERRYSKPIWPGGNTGITIGFGYDLGYFSDKDFRATWGALLPANDVDRLASAIGKKDQEAKDLLPSLSDIVVPWDAAYDVFMNTTLAKFGALVVANFPNAKELPPDSFGALVSLVFNRGVSFSGERRKEMAAIRDLMAQRQFDKVPDQIRAMKRHIAPALPGLLKRRDAEAALFEKGLLEARTGQAGQKG
jgi:hypothetical protein